MSDDFYTMVDSGDPAPDNEHITGVREERDEDEQTAVKAPAAMYAARIAVYDDMLSTPRVIVIDPQDVRTYLEETTNTVYQLSLIHIFQGQQALTPGNDAHQR